MVGIPICFPGIPETPYTPPEVFYGRVPPENGTLGIRGLVGYQLG